MESNNYLHKNAVIAERRQIISVLPNDYDNMENKPRIEGTELKGNVFSEDLNLLSSKVDRYETISFNSLEEEDYIVVLDNDKPTKMAIKDIISANSGFAIGSEVISDLPIGAYQFLEIVKE